MVTIRELTKKCSVHGTPLASKPVDGTKGQMVGRLYWCPLCDCSGQTSDVAALTVVPEIARQIAKRADKMKRIKKYGLKA
jgi:hypothetical protein